MPQIHEVCRLRLRRHEVIPTGFWIYLTTTSILVNIEVRLAQPDIRLAQLDVKPAKPDVRQAQVDVRQAQLDVRRAELDVGLSQPASC